MAEAPRSIASTRLAQSRSSRPIGGTDRTRARRAARSVCQCSATWSRKPGTMRTVGCVIAGSRRALQEATLVRLAVRREAVALQRLVGVLVELPDAVDPARLLVVGHFAAELARQ